MSDYHKITYKNNRAEEFFENKLAFTLGPVELKKRMSGEDLQIVDLRTKELYDVSRIPTAISIPGANFHEEFEKLDKNKITIVYCYNQQCHLAAKCALKLADKDYPVMELEGGFDAWANFFNFEVES